MSQENRPAVLAQGCALCCFFNKNVTRPDVGDEIVGVCPSLVKQCCQQIGTQQSLLVPSQLKKLPVQLLDSLQYYLDSNSLHSLSWLFEEYGIDTRLSWDRLLHKRFGSSVVGVCEAWVSPGWRKTYFQVAHNCCNPRQVLMAKQCQQLTQHIVEEAVRHSRTVCSQEVVCKPCSSRLSPYLDFVRSFVLSWKQLTVIIRADYWMTSILKSFLERLIDLEIHNTTFADFDDVSNFLRQLVKGDKLRSLAFLYISRRCGPKCGPDILKLLSVLFLPGECDGKKMLNGTLDANTCNMGDVENFEENNVEGYVEDEKGAGDMESATADVYTEIFKVKRDIGDSNTATKCTDIEHLDYIETLDYTEGKDVENSNAGVDGSDLYDEALGSNRQNLYWMHDTAALVDIRTRIKHVQSAFDSAQDITGVASLRFPLFEGRPRPLARLFPFWKNVKRLNLESIGNNGFEEAVVLLGCRHLSHLRLSFIENVHNLPLLFAVLFENYRCSHEAAQPMEYLGLSDVCCSESSASASLCQYDFEICAVRRLELDSCRLDSAATSGLINFLSHNTSLTHLELTNIQLELSPMTHGQAELPPLLAAISKTRCLETLILRNNEHMTGSRVLRLASESHVKALLSLLQCQPRLKHLDLNDCGLTQQIVSKPDFKSTLKQLKHLEHLSMSNNRIGPAAIDLLMDICESCDWRALKGVDLEYCDIKGQPLIKAAQHISGCLKGRVYLQYLNLSHNRVDLQQLLQIRRLLSSSVTLLDIKGSNYRRESRLADFYEEEVDQ